MTSRGRHTRFPTLLRAGKMPVERFSSAPKDMFANELSYCFYRPKLAKVSLITSIIDLAVQRSRPL